MRIPPGTTKEERIKNKRKRSHLNKEKTKLTQRLSCKRAAIREAAEKEKEMRLAAAQALAAKEARQRLEERQRRKAEQRIQKAIRKRSRKIQGAFSDTYMLATFLRFIFPPHPPKKPSQRKVSSSPKKKDAPPVVKDYVGSAWRWRHFGSDRQAIPDLLTFLTSAHSPQSVRKQVTEFAISHVEGILQSEARKVTQLTILWAKGKRIDEEFLESFNLQELHDTFESDLAPTSMRILKYMATSKDQQKKMSMTMQQRKETVSAKAALTVVPLAHLCIRPGYHNWLFIPPCGI